MYYAWAVAATLAVNPEAVMELKNPLGNYVGLPLVLVTIAGAVAGRGAASGLLALSAVMGLFLWITLGFL